MTTPTLTSLIDRAIRLEGHHNPQQGTRPPLDQLQADLTLALAHVRTLTAALTTKGR